MGAVCHSATASGFINNSTWPAMKAAIGLQAWTAESRTSPKLALRLAGSVVEGHRCCERVSTASVVKELMALQCNVTPACTVGIVTKVEAMKAHLRTAHCRNTCRFERPHFQRLHTPLCTISEAKQGSIGRREILFGNLAHKPLSLAAGSVGSARTFLRIRGNYIFASIGSGQQGSSVDNWEWQRLGVVSEEVDCRNRGQDANGADAATTIARHLPSHKGWNGQDSANQSSKQFAVVNFYHFTEIDDPHGEVERHLAFVEELDIRSRIYINEQGINAQLSGPIEDVLAYGEWVKADSRFHGMALQVSPSPMGHAFPRLKLRYKPSLVQVEGGTAQLPLTEASQRAVPLTPRQWREKLEAAEFVAAPSTSSATPHYHPVEQPMAVQQSVASSAERPMTDEQSVAGSTERPMAEGQQGTIGDLAIISDLRGEAKGREGELSDSIRSASAGPGEVRGSSEVPTRKVLLLDVRNGYEWDVGHFENAVRPEVNSFRTTEFGMTESEEDGAQDPLARVDRESTDVLMYCTGGIRCDVYSAMLRRRGFNNLYTLQGGVAGYLKEEGARHWAGSLFVFDSRLAVPPAHYKAGKALTIGQPEPQGDEGQLLGEGADSPPEAGSQSLFARCTSCEGRLETVRHRNCANLDCNKLFLVCKECAQGLKGCCSPGCQSAPRLRPFLEEAQPYDRWHNYRSPTPPRPPGVLTGRALRRQQRKQQTQSDTQVLSEVSPTLTRRE